MLGENVPPSELLQARWPRVDLDSLYDAGPGDPESAKFSGANGLHLNAGRTVAAEGVPAMDGFDNRGVRARKLISAQIGAGRHGAELDALTKPQRAALLRDTPLWFYILREAEFNGGKLKGVGARIVAETFHRAMEGSKASIVRDPTWRLTLGPNSTTFRMVDLLLFAFEGQKTLLAPLG